MLRLQTQDPSLHRALTMEHLGEVQKELKGYLAKNPRLAASSKLEKLVHYVEELGQLLNEGNHKNSTSRMKAFIKLSAEPYLYLLLNDSDSKFSKGPSLKLLENCLDKVLIADRKDGSVPALLMHVLGGATEYCQDSVDALFNQAIVEGIGENEPTLFAKAAQIVMLMGPYALERWNQRAAFGREGYNSAILSGIYLRGDEEKRDDVEHNLNAIRKNAAWRQTICQIHSLEVLSHLVHEAVYKAKEKLSAASGDKVATLSWVTTQLQHLDSQLRKLEQKSVAEYYVPTLKAYLTAYLQAKRGEELADALEAVLKKFHKLTGSELFEGKNKESHVLSSLSDVQIDDVQRHAVVDHVVTQVMQEGFLPGEKAQALFMNSLKAILLLGTAGVDVWNERVASLKLDGPQGDSPNYPFLDLVLNVTNSDEDEMYTTYQALSQSEAVREFLTSGALAQMEVKESIELEQKR